MRETLIAVAAIAALAAASFASSAIGSDIPRVATAKVVVPNVVGLRMDRSTRLLHQRGLRVNEECSGLFGCIVKSRWWICAQDPRAGTRVPRWSVVVTFGERRGEC